MSQRTGVAISHGLAPDDDSIRPLLPWDATLIKNKSSLLQRNKNIDDNHKEHRSTQKSLV